MDLIVVNTKLRKPNGALQPLRYVNANHRFDGDLLVIEHDSNKGRATAKIPREHVAQIIEVA